MIDKQKAIFLGKYGQIRYNYDGKTGGHST